MLGTRSRTSVAAFAVAILGATAAACGGSGTSTDVGGESGGAIPTNTTRIVTTHSLPQTAACTPESLAKATAKFTEPTIVDQSCTLDAAIATIFPKDGPKKGVVGFFTIGGEGWTLAKDTSPDSDLAAEAPPGFPPSLIENWKNKYVDPTKTTTTTTTRPTTTTTAKASSTTSSTGKSTNTSAKSNNR